MHLWLNSQKKKKKKSPIFVVFHQKAKCFLSQKLHGNLWTGLSLLGKRNISLIVKLNLNFSTSHFFFCMAEIIYVLCKKTFQYKEKKNHILIDLIFSPNFWLVEHWESLIFTLRENYFWDPGSSHVIWTSLSVQYFCDLNIQMLLS